MLPPSPVRRGPGGRPVPGSVDPLRVAAPWMWNGLSAAIAPMDGVLRDWVSGRAPSAMVAPLASRDPRGGSCAFFSGTVQANQDFADTGDQDRPSTALTVFMRFRPNGTNVISSTPFAKVLSANNANIWFFQCGAANTASWYGSITVDGVGTSTVGGFTGTALFTNTWLRWQSGEVLTMDKLRDDGTAAIAQVASAAVATGSLSASTQPIRVGGGETVARAAPGGDFSVGLVWNRRLSDQEMFAVTFDPFGFLRRA